MRCPVATCCCRTGSKLQSGERLSICGKFAINTAGGASAVQALSDAVGLQTGPGSICTQHSGSLSTARISNINRKMRHPAAICPSACHPACAHWPLYVATGAHCRRVARTGKGGSSAAALRVCPGGQGRKTARSQRALTAPRPYGRSQPTLAQRHLYILYITRPTQPRATLIALTALPAALGNRT